MFLLPLFDKNPHYRFPAFTLLIIALNVGVTIWMSTLDTTAEIDAIYNYGFMPKRISQLETGKPLTVRVDLDQELVQANPQLANLEIELPADPSSIYLTLLTTMFMHGGWLHLAMNMWMLWIFGNNIEDRLGHVTYVIYYLLGGLVATLTHWAIDPQSQLPLVGASGAVAAVLGGYAISYPKAKVRTLVFIIVVPLLLDLPALLLLGVWFILNLVSGLFPMFQGAVDQPIAFWAHVGGFIAGIVLLPFLGLGAPPPETDWRKEADEQFSFDNPQTQDR